MAAQNKKPVTSARETAASVPDPGHAPISELLSDRAAAPSPFGDELTFPLPVEELNYISADKY